MVLLPFDFALFFLVCTYISGVCNFLHLWRPWLLALLRSVFIFLALSYVNRLSVRIIKNSYIELLLGLSYYFLVSRHIYICIHTYIYIYIWIYIYLIYIYIYIPYIYICIYTQSWNQCALPVITTMALWQLIHLGTWWIWCIP